MKQIVISAEPLPSAFPPISNHCAVECSLCGPVGVTSVEVADLIMRDHAATHMKERV